MTVNGMKPRNTPDTRKGNGRPSLPASAYSAYSAVKLGHGSSITAKHYKPRGPRQAQRLNRGIRQIRAREMDRLSLPAFAYSAHSAVALAAPVAAWPAEPQRELPQGPATSGRKIEGEKMKARPDRHPSCLGG